MSTTSVMRASERRAIIDKKSHELGESPRAVKAKKFSRFVMVVNPPQHLNFMHCIVHRWLVDGPQVLAG